MVTRRKELIFVLSAIFLLSVTATAFILLLVHVLVLTSFEELKKAGEIIAPVFLFFGFLVLALCMRARRRIEMEERKNPSPK